MKKLLLAFALCAVTVGLVANENCCPKDKAACADKNKAACGQKTAGCPMSKGQCPAGGTAKSDKKAQSPKDAAKS